MRKKILITTVLLIQFATVFIGAITGTYAAGKFDTKVTREYWLQDDMTVKVKEVEKITNSTSNLYIPSGSDKEFEILAIEIGADENKTILEQSLATMKLSYGNGTKLNYTTSVQSDSVTIFMDFPYDLNPGQSITFTLEYTHYGMAEKNGALTDMLLNGFAQNSVFEDSQNVTVYETRLYIPKNTTVENFVLPEGGVKSESGNYVQYSFTQQQLIDRHVWIQLGLQQFYKFKISQSINASESLNTGNQNRYEIVIPRSIDEAQISQKIFYSKISPEPEWIKEDENGNLLASFKLSSNFIGEITLEGYASLDKTKGVDLSKLGNLSAVDTGKMSEFLSEDPDYWQVNNSLIQQKATELKGSETDIAKLVDITYRFVIDQIDYSEVKRFGLNERQGAVKTLQGGSAVCMEYSDLFLTLMRAEGVPARAAFGYGYDPKVDSGAQEGHQWVEVYAPTLDEWVGVDVTWGENGDALIGGDLNHLYTHVAAKSPDDPPGISSLGFGELNLEPASYDIEVLAEFDQNSLMTEKDLLAKYPYDGNAVSEAVDLVHAKFDAIYTNLRDGNQLSSDQVFILIVSVMVILIGGMFVLGITRKLMRLRK